MSDSFADLWNSTVPTPSTKPQTLGSISRPPATNGTGYRPNDAFSMLSSAGSSSKPATRSVTPASIPKSNGPSPKPYTTSSGDAFSGLLSGAISAKPTSQMTIAERAAQAEKERREAALKAQAVPKTSSAWDGLDTLSGGSLLPSSPPPPRASSSTPSRPKPATVIDDDWGLGGFGKPTPASVAADDDWGLGGLDSKPTATPAHDDGWGMDQLPSARSRNLWDMDDFSNKPPSRKPDSPSNDFDFGGREDDDDILGDLAKPPEQSRRPSPAVPSLPERRPQSRAVSPPPHILGRIVEMGFSIQQARVALASTDTGLDVEAALETLLSNGAASGSNNPSPPPPLPRRSTNNTQSPPPRTRTREPQTSPSQGERNLQDQADKIMQQASQIGLSFFNKANAAWREGKDRVQKAYAERITEGAEDGKSSGRSSANGRPKWMQNADGWKDEDEHNHSSGSFSDEPDTPHPRPLAPPRAQPQLQPQTSDLFSVDDTPKPYVSPFRRGKPSTPAPAPAPTPPRRAPTPPPAKPLRTLVTASSSSIATSQSHKAQGADKFKLGQYGDAEGAYTRAIECLPSGHFLLIPLYNNRALVRLKTGDYNGAAEDSGVVLELVDESTWQDEQKRTKSAEQGAGVDLGDALVKAWKRRAEALEGREKWDDARRDWESVAGAGWAASGMRNEGVRGIGRCKKMLMAEKQEVEPKPRPKAARPPPRRGPTPPSQALADLKKANEAAAAEDNAKYDLKDSVDAKLIAWKGGKETNIRALIASLDSVLWAELGLQKTSIAELVTPGQVKIRYTKAIAKLHPDKLNDRNSTLEQRMIANGVFGTLNEAWNAFKQ
ncbi:hypothetical protein BDZ89DRAFT_1099198 [Hymenopellis radicata]|nr:hypothetical protein BDZ89DRAFT_1099198 [Hymenopellis radicata]